MLNHLDLSGLSLEKEHLLTLCPVVALAENIQCFHLNDNSIRNDFELMLEILDIFGISEQAFKKKIDCKLNRRIKDPARFKKIIKEKCNSINKHDVLNSEKPIDQKTYKDHLMLAKQGKLIANNKLLNQAQVMQGIGKQESSLIDQLVLTRKVNQPELVFN